MASMVGIGKVKTEQLSRWPEAPQLFSRSSIKQGWPRPSLGRITLFYPVHLAGNRFLLVQHRPVRYNVQQFY